MASMSNTIFRLFIVLSFFASESANAETTAVSGAISATATVIHPIGLIEARDTAEAYSMPIFAEYSSRWFLYLPQGNALVHLNGVPIEIGTERPDDILTALDVTSLVNAKAGASPLVVTVIYTGN